MISVSPSWTVSPRWFTTVRWMVTIPRSGFDVSRLSVILSRTLMVSPILMGPLKRQRRPRNARVANGRGMARLPRPDEMARPRRPWAIRSPKMDVRMNSASVWSTL